MKENYKIASVNLPKFEESLGRINKKARKLGLPEVGYHEISREHIAAKDYYDVAGTDECAHPAFDLITVVLYGETPYIRNWRLMGVLEHTPDFEFPILHNVPRARIPESYWTDNSKRCDHCNSRRNRKDTFILQNAQTLEYKQIGRQCLADFLPGVTPEDALRYSEFYRSISSSLDEDYEEPDFNNQIKWDHAEHDLIKVLAISSAVIRVDGWLSSTKAKEQDFGEATASLVRSLLNPRTAFMSERERSEFRQWASVRKPTEGDLAIATKALEWMRSDSFAATTEYAHNLKVIALKGATNNRNINISVSAIPAYLKFIDQQDQLKRSKETRVNEWVGQEGQRLKDLNLEVQSTRSLESIFGVTTLINFRDAEGRLITWFASTPIEVWKGEKYNVTGTVKKLETFNGTKQTILTRCKIEKVKELALAE